MDTDVKIRVYLFYYSVLFKCHLTIVGDRLYLFKVHADINLTWWVIKHAPWRRLKKWRNNNLHYPSQHQMQGKGQSHAQSALLLNKE